MEPIATKVATMLFSQYGLLGILTVLLGLYVLKKERDHRDERKELVAALERQHTEALEVTKGNTTVLTEVKTLIQTLHNK